MNGAGIPQRWRLYALRLMGVALAVLAVLPATTSATPSEPSDNTQVSEVASPTDAVDAPTDALSDPADESLDAVDAVPTPVPVTITRLWSPVPGTARVEGTWGSGPLTVQVLLNGVPLNTTNLQLNDDNRFEFNIDDLPPGAHTVCLDNACARVFIDDPATAAPVAPADAAETPVQLAIAQARAAFDFDEHLPEWTLNESGPSSSSTGFTNPATKSIFIDANPDRSVSELTVIVLRQLAHAVDAELLTNEQRAAFAALRGHDAALEWRASDQLAGEPTGAQDFAEVFVAWAFDGAYAITTTGVAPQPEPGELAVFCQVLALASLNCAA